MLKNMCRVCGRYAAYKKSMKVFENPNLLWSIQVLTGIVLENAECLPDLICICCQTELREAIRFSERVIAAQQQLLSALTEDELQEISKEYREAIMELSNNFSEIETNTNCSDTQSESAIINQQETEEEFNIQEQNEEHDVIIEDHNKQEDLVEYDVIIDDDGINDQTEFEEFQTYETQENTFEGQQLTIEAEDHNNSAFILPDKSSDEEFAELDKVLSDEIATSQKRVKKEPARKRGTNLKYVCDECGNHITGRMAFELHCRRHRGDKQYECDICQDRFCTSSELKRHIRRHTGERPFACQYCGRCFTDYSTRVKHERTHTNERPYVCQSCGKAFTTAYILKNHMLIHSGERAFSCDLCNKTFIRQTHLVTHCRSSAHKRNLEKQNQEVKI